jgi:hypothetical protein
MYYVCSWTVCSIPSLGLTNCLWYQTLLVKWLGDLSTIWICPMVCFTNCLFCRRSLFFLLRFPLPFSFFYSMGLKFDHIIRRRSYETLWWLFRLRCCNSISYLEWSTACLNALSLGDRRIISRHPDHKFFLGKYSFYFEYYRIIRFDSLSSHDSGTCTTNDSDLSSVVQDIMRLDDSRDTGYDMIFPRHVRLQG